MLKKSALVTLLLVSGCGQLAAGQIAAPVLDAAHALCVARERSALGAAVEAYCDNEENLRPYVDLLLRQARAAQRSGCGE